MCVCIMAKHKEFPYSGNPQGILSTRHFLLDSKYSFYKPLLISSQFLPPSILKATTSIIKMPLNQHFDLINLTTDFHSWKCDVKFVDVEVDHKVFKSTKLFLESPKTKKNKFKRELANDNQINNLLLNLRDLRP